ncbi:MAG: glycosyltransferase [Ectothiorhodospiraceae bacterium]|nr:glycosyltransferase [Ectothiorhodospiraceae bacterium]
MMATQDLAASADPARVLAVLSDGLGAGGGIARYGTDLLRALQASERVASTRVVARHGADGVRGRRLSQRVAAGGRAGFALALGAERGRRYDAVVCGHLNLLPAALAVSRDAPVWLLTYGIEAWRPRRRWAARALERVALVTAISRDTRRRLLQWSAIAPERVRVLPPTVSPDLTPGPADSRLAAALGLGRRRVLLTVGRLDPAERYKGHDRVIGALPALVAAGHDCAYLVVGEGGDRARLEAVARAAGVAERVVFAGHVDDGRLADHYRLADVFVMPSTGEGFGIVFLEAVACGCRVVGLDAAGARDALRDGALGALVAGDDLVPTLAAVLTAPPDPETARRRRDAMLAAFGPAVFAAEVDAMLDRLRGEAAPSPTRPEPAHRGVGIRRPEPMS